MMLQYVFHYTAFLATSILHLYWNQSVSAAMILIVYCLSNDGSPILLKLLKLHSLVLSFFVIAACFRMTSAGLVQNVLKDVRPTQPQTLDFDELPTGTDGFGSIPDSYHHLYFVGFAPFNPLDPAFRGVISPNDHNCAVSLPNALYGSSFVNENLTGGQIMRDAQRPRICVDTGHPRPATIAPYFTLISVRVKPLDMPIAHATLFFKAITLSREPNDSRRLEWNVTFPAGFHDMLHVDFEKFTGQKWDTITMLEVWAQFENGDFSMDWEFCMDDIEIELAPTRDADLETCE